MATGPRHPLTATLVMAATLVWLTLPPSHIHLAEHDDHDHDHAAAVEHSHWSSHGASRAALDDDEGRAMFVDHPALTRVVDTALARPSTALIAMLNVPAPATFVAVERTTSGNSPRDGPSRTTRTLRAPPAFVTL